MPNLIYKKYFISEVNFDKNISPKYMKFLTDIHEKDQNYFNRAAEITNLSTKDIAEVIYEKCLD